ncbi:hypothetical protein TNCV_2789821 [Trichonephila clavipes]|nr:hypothetical protein TNCV_2789821 [Trichonephila clavipes]
MTKCSTIEPSWSPTRRIRSRLEHTTLCLTVQKSAFGLDIYPRIPSPQLIQKGFHVEISESEKFNQTPYKLPPPTPIHVPAEKHDLWRKKLYPRNEYASLPS